VTRKSYPKEFKLDAISLVKEQGYSVADAAKSLGINKTMLARWIKENSDDNSQTFPGNEKLTPEQEIRQLKEENKRLKIEKEILKKAAVFFAKETA
jgi:transposase